MATTAAPPTTSGPVEAPLTLDEAPRKVLGLADQTVLWGNLGVSLLLPVTATFILTPDPSVAPLSLGAALVAIVVGSLIGNTLLGLGALPGADTGAPAMVLYRGLLGRRGSYLPTALNLAQCVGWSVFEIVIIAEAAARLTDDSLRPLFVVLAGGLATLMAIRPLGVVHALKRVAVWLVLASTAYLFVQVLRRPLPPLDDGSWEGFWKAADLVIALSVSWVPLAADYSRHSRTGRDAFLGAFLGYSASGTAFFALGVLALAGYGLDPGFDVIDALLAVPAGALALLVLAVDEVDEAFANIYSTAVSAQNVAPRVDRRVLALGVGVGATLAALVFDIVAYEGFLFLIGSVFVPLFGTFAAAYYVLDRRRGWDVSERAPARWWFVLPWAAGFVAYQLVNPGTVGWWQRFWLARADDVGFSPPTWLSASLTGLAVAGGLTLLLGTAARRRPAPSRRP
ncbi:MAG TPA: cytosine permease [Acidimicrobiales bacterium]|jgi:putative hydroxymethylpyrimidine transporter CytX|nr:cytosine permease [Acidimicrobiales bacterium]